MNDITVFAIFLLLIFCITYLVNTYLRLRHIPGPFLANFNDVWRLYYMNRPGYGERLVQLHRKYGPVMRLGPNHISMADPDMVGPPRPVTDFIGPPRPMPSSGGDSDDDDDDDDEDEAEERTRKRTREERPRPSPLQMFDSASSLDMEIDDPHPSRAGSPTAPSKAPAYIPN